MNDLINICCTCLSKDRRLIPLQEIKMLLKDIRFLEFQESTSAVCWECWGILYKLHKFKKRVQIAQDTLSQSTKDTNLKSLTSLMSKTNLSYDYEYNFNTDPLNNNCENKPKAESDLIKQEIEQSDDTTELPEIIENLYVEQIDVKHDEKFLKPEKSSEDVDLDNKCVTKAYCTQVIFNETDNKLSILNENVYADTIGRIPSKHFIKKEINRIKKAANTKRLSHKTQINEKEFQEKFMKVVLSEEEMVRVREDKRNHHNFMKLPFKCDSCVLGFTKEETYNLHVKKKHDLSIGDYICKVCSVRFPNKMALTKHNSSHYVLYKCRLCRHEVHELCAALNHCHVKHAADTTDTIHCHQCRAVVKSPQELEHHMQTVHTLYCNECGVKFKAKNTLRRHKARIHSVIREFICDICTKTFKTKTRLESHMVKHNASIAKKLAYCHLCQIQYKNIYVYRNHLKSSANHAENVYPCPVCNKKFASKVYWTKHYNFYHLQKSQYNCEICNKLFISDWRLKNHKQKHHGLSRSRDHSCNVCNKKFYTLATLRSHKLTHSDHRSYMCEDCGDTFKQRPALYTHTRLVHRGGGKKK